VTQAVRQGKTCGTIQIFILYLPICLNSKKLYLWIQMGHQILSCTPDPPKTAQKTYTKIEKVTIDNFSLFIYFHFKRSYN
jgi:hypothetical protein